MNALEAALGFAVLDLHPIEHLLNVRLESRRWFRRRRGDAIRRAISALPQRDDKDTDHIPEQPFQMNGFEVLVHVGSMPKALVP